MREVVPKRTASFQFLGSRFRFLGSGTRLGFAYFVIGHSLFDIRHSKACIIGTLARTESKPALVTFSGDAYSNGYTN
jgi:hypothetical protein